MATLNIRNIDEGLKAEVKAAAAMAQMTLSEFCMMIFRSMNFRQVAVRDRAQDIKNLRNVARVGEEGLVGADSGISEGVSVGVPPPVFRTDVYVSDPKNDFPIVGLNSGSELQEPFCYGRAGDSLQPMVHLPIHGVVGEYGGAPKTHDELLRSDMVRDVPPVPDAVFEQVKELLNAAQDLTGADPSALKALEPKKGARTMQGISQNENKVNDKDEFLYSRAAENSNAPGSNLKVNRKQIKPMESK